MLDLIECGRNKLDDPVLMTWALRHYERAQRRGSEHCRSMEDAWFHDLALRRWIDADDHAVLARLFRALPSRQFSNLKPAIVARWNAWSGSLGASATSVLMECPVQEVLALLARHIESNLGDVEKTVAVIRSITELPRSNALELLDVITGRVSELREGGFTKQILLAALLRSTAALNLPALVSLTETYARTTRLDRDGTNLVLRAVYCALFGDAALMGKAKDYMEGERNHAFHSLQCLFTSGAPLEECDRALSKANPWPEARHLLEKYRTASAATEIAFAITSVTQSMDGVAAGDMACFAVAAILGAFERNEMEVCHFSMEEALNVLTLDLSDHRHLLKLTQRLGAFAPRDVARALGERMPAVKDRWGAVHLATMAGRLRLVDAIPALIDCLRHERGNFLCEAAQESLVRIGEPAQRVLIAQWDALDSSQKIYGKSTIEQIGGECTLKFAIERFGELFCDDEEGWCALVEAVPDGRAIDLLEPEVGRKQAWIDESFYRLCVLTGREHDKLKEVRERVVEHRQRVLKRQADLAVGNFRNLHDTVTLTLKCERCGDVNCYEVKSIVLGASKSRSACFVGDDLPCASCGEWPDFEFTNETHMQLMAAMIILAADKQAAKDGRKGAFQLVDVHYRWKTRPAPEAMAELKAAAAQDPLNVVSQLRLARFQYVFGRRGRAAECYGRALEIEPDCLEAGLGIAQILADKGERRSALDRLSDMLERRSKWCFFRIDELSPKGLTEDFARLFNTLHSALGLRGGPLLHTSFVQVRTRVGRNDPCPCRSGKKYKKCCGITQALMAR